MLHIAVVCFQIKMSSLKAEDRLEGAIDFAAWKVRILLILEENDLLKFVVEESLSPLEDVEELKQFKKDSLKARRIIIESIKNHLVTVISKFVSAREMIKHLEGMYEVNSLSRALALRQQLLHMKMKEEDSIIAYFMKINELKDKLSTLDCQISDKDLVMIALNGLPDEWEPFIRSIGGRADRPNFERLQSNYIEEESRIEVKGKLKNSHKDNHVLLAKSRKGGHWKKEKRSKDFRSSSYDPRKKPRDSSHIRCFRCDKYAHYARDCQNDPKVLALPP